MDVMMLKREPQRRSPGMISIGTWFTTHSLRKSAFRSTRDLSQNPSGISTTCESCLNAQVNVDRNVWFSGTM